MTTPEPTQHPAWEHHGFIVDEEQTTTDEQLASITAAAVTQANILIEATTAELTLEQALSEIDALHDEVTFLTLGLEVRAELYRDLQTTNQHLTTALAESDERAAGFKALIFHLAEESELPSEAQWADAFFVALRRQEASSSPLAQPRPLPWHRRLLTRVTR